MLPDLALPGGSHALCCKKQTTATGSHPDKQFTRCPCPCKVFIGHFLTPANWSFIKIICTFKCHNHYKYYGTLGCTFNIFSSLWLHGCVFFYITNRHDCKSHNQNAKSSQTITEGRMPRLCNLILLKMCDYQLTSVREI